MLARAFSAKLCSRSALRPRYMSYSGHCPLSPIAPPLQIMLGSCAQRRSGCMTSAFFCVATRLCTGSRDGSGGPGGAEGRRSCIAGPSSRISETYVSNIAHYKVESRQAKCHTPVSERVEAHQHVLIVILQPAADTATSAVSLDRRIQCLK